MLMLLFFCVGVAVFARHIMLRIYFYCFLMYFYLSVEFNVSDLHNLESIILPCQGCQNVNSVFY